MQVGQQVGRRDRDSNSGTRKGQRFSRPANSISLNLRLTPNTPHFEPTDYAEVGREVGHRPPHYGAQGDPLIRLSKLQFATFTICAFGLGYCVGQRASFVIGVIGTASFLMGCGLMSLGSEQGKSEVQQ